MLREAGLTVDQVEALVRPHLEQLARARAPQPGAQLSA
jgi:hypothetical protein